MFMVNLDPFFHRFSPFRLETDTSFPANQRTCNLLRNLNAHALFVESREQFLIDVVGRVPKHRSGNHPGNLQQD